MTPASVVTDDELLACRECGSPCRVETFGPTPLMEGALWVCANNERFGGNCPSDLGYFSAEHWNDRPVVTDDALLDVLILKARVFERSVGGPVSEMENNRRELMDARAALAASDRDVLVAENERLREALLAAREKLSDEDRSIGFIDAALIPLGGEVAP